MWAVQLLGYVPLQSAIEKGDKKMRNQLKMGYVEYEEIEKSRQDEPNITSNLNQEVVKGKN